jgi:integrase
VDYVEVEEQRLMEHVVPHIGRLKLAEVRPRHAYQLVQALKRTKSRRGGVLAPRTVRGIFFTTRQVFQHAVLEELLVGNPMVLARGILPAVEDKDPTWRLDAVFNQDEVERLISDDRIPPQRRVAYAIEFLTGLRTGEVSALRWGDYSPNHEPLGRIVAARSYDSKKGIVKVTKTKVAHVVPVHPTLAKVLASWRVGGWAKWMQRNPTDEDLLIPTAKGNNRDVRVALASFYAPSAALRQPGDVHQPVPGGGGLTHRGRDHHPLQAGDQRAGGLPGLLAPVVEGEVRGGAVHEDGAPRG